MNERLEKALSIARTLSSEEQDELASVMLTVMGAGTADSDEIYQLTPQDEEAIRISLEQAARGEFASDAEIEALWNKFT